MIHSALILMATLPTGWLVVGCGLVALTLVSLFLCLFKWREAARLNKEVMELRDTMRMMRYEEANLSRMLHTVSRTEAAETEYPADEVVKDEEEVVEEPIKEQTAEQHEITTVALLPTDKLDTEEEHQTITSVENETIIDEHDVEVSSSVATEDTTSLSEEEIEASDLVVAAIEESSNEDEKTSEAIEAQESLPEATEMVSVDSLEDDIKEETEEKMEEPTNEEAAPNADDKESLPTVIDIIVVKPEDLMQEKAVVSKTRKQAINERRPAIPNDLFAAWFEENELADLEEDETPISTTDCAEITMETEPSSGMDDDTTYQTDVLTSKENTPIESVAINIESAAHTTTMDNDSIDNAPIELSKEDERFRRKLERIVNARMRNPNLNVDVIASQFGMGRTNFYRKVRELMGMSPNDYLRKCRMERAAELLRSTELNITEVCAQIGVPDAQYFSRVFKAHFGMPPSSYREQ